MPKTTEIRLPIYDIVVNVIKGQGGSLSSNLKDDKLDGEDDLNEGYEDAIDGLESLILALACEGVNIASKPFINAINTAVEAIANQYS